MSLLGLNNELGRTEVVSWGTTRTLPLLAIVLFGLTPGLSLYRFSQSLAALLAWIQPWPFWLITDNLCIRSTELVGSGALG